MAEKLKNWLTQIKKGYLDLCILTLIEAEGKAYGFQILSILDEVNIPMKEGTLYPLLNRMTKDGFLKSTWETEGIKGHPRKFYSLTKAGEKSLQQMKDEFSQMNTILKTIGGKKWKVRNLKLT